MLFNSFGFIFAFLPACLILFYVARLAGRTWAMWALSLASLTFYAVWNPRLTWVLLVSIIFNFIVGHYLQEYREKRPALTRTLLIFGLSVDLGALLYFKYTILPR